MPRLLTASAVALIPFGASLASAQSVPSSDADSRAGVLKPRVASGF